jgi:tRNA (guanine-N7-)-methyltransferase
MQSFIHIESPNYLRAENLEKPADWQAVFGNDHPIALEIGCGIGDFIALTAAERPETNFIAIDFYNKGCYKTCRRIDVQPEECARPAEEACTIGKNPSSLPPSTNCPDPGRKNTGNDVCESHLHGVPAELPSRRRFSLPPISTITAAMLPA